MPLPKIFYKLKPRLPSVMYTPGVNISALNVGALPRGYSTNPADFISKDWLEPEQDTMYHVTTANDRVLKEGLRARKELGTVALGGGLKNEAPDMVSVTYDYSQAHAIYSVLKLAAEATRGDIGPDEIIKYFDQFYFSNKEIAEALDAPEEAYDDDEVLDVWILNNYDTPKELYSLIQRLDNDVGAKYSDDGGYGYLVGLTADWSNMAKIDPNQIAILQVAGRIGVKVGHVPEEAEIRFYPQDVWVVSEDKPALMTVPRKYQPATKKQPACGTCYQDAMKFIIKSKTGTLVHGAVTNTTGEVLGHAWVVFEGGEYVFEPQTGEVFKKKWFYDKFKAREITTYPAEQAMVNVLKYQSYGPWDDKAILPVTELLPALEGLPDDGEKDPAGFTRYWWNNELFVVKFHALLELGISREHVRKPFNELPKDIQLKLVRWVIEPPGEYMGKWQPGDYAIYSYFGARSLLIVNILPVNFMVDGKPYLNFAGEPPGGGAVLAQVVDTSLYNWDLNDKRVDEWNDVGSRHTFNYTNLWHNIDDLIEYQRVSAHSYVMDAIADALHSPPLIDILREYGLAKLSPLPKAFDYSTVKKIPQDADGNDLADLDGTPMELNKDGTLTLYHRTTPEAADQIRRTGNFKSLENTNETFFSNKLTGQAVGYGDAVVAVKIKPKQVRINDAFHDGEVHVAVSNRLLSRANLIDYPATTNRTAVGYRVGYPNESVAWKILEYEHGELGNEHTRDDVVAFMGLPKETRWPQALAKFREKWDDIDGVWLMDDPKEAISLYADYTGADPATYKEGDVLKYRYDPAMKVIELGGDGSLVLNAEPVDDYEYQPATREEYRKALEQLKKEYPYPMYGRADWDRMLKKRGLFPKEFEKLEKEGREEDRQREREEKEIEKEYQPETGKLLRAVDVEIVKPGEYGNTRYTLIQIPLDALHIKPVREQERYDRNYRLMKERGTVPPIYAGSNPNYGDKFGISDGIHRANVARDLGYKSIPAWVPNEDLSRLKNYEIITDYDPATRADAQPILNVLRRAGFKPRLVGSVAKKGHSEHDIDIVLPLDMSMAKFNETPQYQKYRTQMELLGYELSEGDDFNVQYPYDGWGKGWDETKKVYNLWVDIFFEDINYPAEFDEDEFKRVMGKGAEYAPETRADAEPIIRALVEAGFAPRLVGSIAKTGHSEHDIDIVLPFHLGSGTEEEGTFHEYWDDPEYKKFIDVMLRLGFRIPAVAGEGVYAIKGGKGKPGTIHVDFFIENADEPEPFNEAEWMKEHGREYAPAVLPKVSYTMTPGNPGAVYAYLGDRFIGSLLYTLSTGEAKIVNLNVSPLHLRQGVATGLYNAFEAEMLKKGVYRVLALSVEPGVEPFWKSVGFIRSGDDPRNWNKRISGAPDSLPATEEIIYQAYIVMPGSPMQYYQIVRISGPKNTVQYKTMIKTEGGAWIGNIRTTAAEAMTLIPTNNKRLKVVRPLPAREL